eukprot:1144236-Pelagomonas_calceolata.AAC.4
MSFVPGWPILTSACMGCPACCWSWVRTRMGDPSKVLDWHITLYATFPSAIYDYIKIARYLPLPLPKVRHKALYEGLL